MRKLALWMMIALFLGGCAPATLPPLPPPTEQSLLPELTGQRQQMTTTAYTIGPEDVLQVTIYDHPDLSQQVIVSEDGFVYPLIGQVQTVGLTVRQLEEQMRQRLAEGYLVDPQVTITVAQYGSRQVYVLGAVRSPGVYPLRHDTTLLELISQAGGPTPDAGSDVIVVRSSQRDNEKARSTESEKAGIEQLQIDLEKLLAGEMTQRIAVYNGDTVYVPRRTFFYVAGEVKRPGQYPLERETTVFKAITLAGGITDFAAPKRMIVQRVVDGQRREFQAEMNDLLQAEDVLLVPESRF